MQSYTIKFSSRFALLLMMFIMVQFGFCLQEGFARERMIQNGESIQEAIDQAKSGDTIEIMPGVYKEHLLINKSLSLKGKKGAILDGGKSGHVIQVKANKVSIEGLTIQNSGRSNEDSGIFVENGDEITLTNNHLKNVHYGIFLSNSKGAEVVSNKISSYPSHFSKRGNGIHLFKGENHWLEGNEIENVQDGIYFDFTKEVSVTNNHISQSRYGMHLMFSKNIRVEQNEIENNITGLMVMDSENLQVFRNRISDHIHFRGYGIILYDSKKIEVRSNEVIRNSTGLSVENATEVNASHNMIAGNQVALEVKGENQQEVFSENNFVGNIVQSKVSDGNMRLDENGRGNYWDDYRSLDLTGDGIGEEVYKAGTLYDRFLNVHPYWQLYFESPSIKLLTKAESLFPTIGEIEVYDAKPLLKPIPMENHPEKEASGLIPGLSGLVFILTSLYVILKGRKGI